jgi:gas vesicle protein
MYLKKYASLHQRKCDAVLQWIRPAMTLINMLQKTTFQLQTAEDRISALETAIKQWQDRAAQAETQLLQLIQDQIKRRAG